MTANLIIVFPAITVTGELTTLIRVADTKLVEKTAAGNCRNKKRMLIRRKTVNAEPKFSKQIGNIKITCLSNI